MPPVETQDELYDHAPIGYATTDSHGVIVRLNQTLCDWVACPHDKLIGTRLRSIFSPAGRVFYETHFAPILKVEGRVDQVAIDLARVDSKRLPTLVNARNVHADDGRLLGTRYMFVDAVERRNYERELLAEREAARAQSRVLSRRTELQALLAEFGARLLAAPVDLVLIWFFAKLHDLVSVDAGFAYVVTPSGLKMEFQSGADGIDLSAYHYIDPGEQVCGKAAQARKPIHVTDALHSDDPDPSFPQKIGASAYLSHPLLADGILLGTLSFASRTRTRFDDDELPFFETAASLVSSARYRASAFAAREESEARTRLALSAARAGSWELDLLTGTCRLSAESAAMHGLAVDNDRVMTKDEWVALLHPDDRKAAQVAIDDALEFEKAYDFSFRVPTPDGKLRWIQGLGSARFDSRGLPVQMTGINLDVTERYEAQERERLLTAEVDHRAKNMLAIVQSVVELTRADDIATFKRAVSGRIRALARAHSLLASSRWVGADIVQIITDELSPFRQSGDRISINGAALQLNPGAAQGIALVIHELATNAVKYGALSCPEGRLSVGWAFQPDATGQVQLRLRWIETKVPDVVPPTTKGFGSTIIQSTMEGQLRGEVRHEWRTGGLSCTLIIPSDVIIGEEAAVTVPAGIRPVPKIARSETRAERGNILVLEDESLIALQIKMTLVDDGWSVVGPASRVDQALSMIDDTHVDAAVLDISVAGQQSFPVADRLAADGIPFAFLTGFAAGTAVPSHLADRPVLAKPFNESELIDIVGRLLLETVPT